MDGVKVWIVCGVAIACAEAPPGADLAHADGAARTAVMYQGFDDLPLGPLGAPWTVSSTGGTFVDVVVPQEGGEDQALRVQGGDGNGDRMWARVDDFSEDALGAALRFDVRPDAAAPIEVRLGGEGPDATRAAIALIRPVGSETLFAVTGGVRTACGPLASETTSQVELQVHAPDAGNPATLDVLVNGVATACAGVASPLGTRVDAVTVVESGRVGWGGDVYYDDFWLTTTD
jgi:hypothetical protein